MIRYRTLLLFYFGHSHYCLSYRPNPHEEYASSFLAGNAVGIGSPRGPASNVATNQFSTSRKEELAPLPAAAPVQISKEEARLASRPRPTIRPGAEPYRPRVGGSAAKDSPTGTKSSPSMESSPASPMSVFREASPQHEQHSVQSQPHEARPVSEGTGFPRVSSALQAAPFVGTAAMEPSISQRAATSLDPGT